MNNNNNITAGKTITKSLKRATNRARKAKNTEYLTVEHFALSFFSNEKVKKMLDQRNINTKKVLKKLNIHLEKTFNSKADEGVGITVALDRIFDVAFECAKKDGSSKVKINHMIESILIAEKRTYTYYCLNTYKKKNKLDIFIQTEDDNTTVRYYAVGTTTNNGFTGYIFGYEGGGEYSGGYVLNDIYLPDRYDDDEPVESDDIEDLMQVAVSDIYMNKLQALTKRYMDYNPDDFTYSVKKEHLRLISKSVFCSSHNLTPISYGNTIFPKGEKYFKTSFETVKNRIESLRKTNVDLFKYDLHGDIARNTIG